MDSAFAEPIFIALSTSLNLMNPETNPDENASPAPVLSTAFILFGIEV